MDYFRGGFYPSTALPVRILWSCAILITCVKTLLGLTSLEEVICVTATLE